jgi:hypothetical protein
MVAMPGPDATLRIARGEGVRVNKLFYGDNLDVLRSFPDECVDLIYLDPAVQFERGL